LLLVKFNGLSLRSRVLDLPNEFKFKAEVVAGVFELIFVEAIVCSASYIFGVNKNMLFLLQLIFVLFITADDVEQFESIPFLVVNLLFVSGERIRLDDADED
jgi:hypothetical protein